MTPLETGASGLVAYTQEFRIERKLQEDAGILEHEVMVDVAGTVSPEVLARFERSPARVSIGRQAEDGKQTGLRFALKGARPGQIAHLCDQMGLTIVAMGASASAACRWRAATGPVALPGAARTFLRG
jgi:23S rRNA pseudouridine2604 synthase